MIQIKLNCFPTTKMFVLHKEAWVEKHSSSIIHSDIQSRKQMYHKNLKEERGSILQTYLLISGIIN